MDLDFIRLSFLSVLREHTDQIRHVALFSCADASFSVVEARSKRGSLPPDATDYRILVLRPAEPGIDHWDAVLLVALRGGKLWNPAVHLAIEDVSSDDGASKEVIYERITEWGLTL